MMTPRSPWLLQIMMLLLLIMYVGGSVWDLSNIIITARGRSKNFEEGVSRPEFFKEK